MGEKGLMRDEAAQNVPMTTSYDETPEEESYDETPLNDLPDSVYGGGENPKRFDWKVGDAQEATPTTREKPTYGKESTLRAGTVSPLFGREPGPMMTRGEEEQQDNLDKNLREWEEELKNKQGGKGDDEKKDDGDDVQDVEGGDFPIAL